MIDILTIRENVISMMDEGLPSTFTYHNSEHTLDVEKQCLIIAQEEGVTDQEILLNLQVAALYHDLGFLYTYEGHEEKSCAIARDQLPDFGFSSGNIDEICEIILSTKVPQSPKNHLQQIICDADLDYLGREDYFVINERLRREFVEYKIIEDNNEWEASRISFLQSHSYFTNSSRTRRNSQKEVNLEKLLHDYIRG